ncbi:MAG: helicase, partial [Nannocystaceae bacterium]
WVQQLVDAGFDAFTIDAKGLVSYEDQPVARLERGAELLHPTVRLQGLEDVGAGARRRIERRLQAWARDLVDGLLAPLRDLEHDQSLGPEARGLLYQLQQGLGTIARRDATAQLKALSPIDRERLVGAGVELGRCVIHLPELSRGRATQRRAAVLRAWTGRNLAVPDSVSAPARDGMLPRDYLRLGYVVLASRAIRADQLERAHAALHALGPGPFELPPQLGSWLGCRRRQLLAIVREMGYRPDDDGKRWVRRRARSRRRRSPAAS